MKLKKLYKVGLILIAMLFFTSTYAGAETAISTQSNETETGIVVPWDGVETYEGNVGVSTTKPTVHSYIPKDGVSTNGTSKPTSVWNLSTQGKYEFAGYAYNNALYTNYLFKGKSQPRFKITNKDSNATLTVELFKSGDWFATKKYTIQPRTTLFFSESLDSNKNYYLKFLPISNFEGYVQ